MANEDSAFLWETEALRGSPIAVPSRKPTATRERGDGWLTLRETESVTGIPISTLRKWVRKDAVPSFIDETSEGPIRMLWLEGVRQRAEALGRDLKAAPKPNGAKKPVEEADVQIDLDAETIEAPAPQEPPTEPAPGTMVVPIEAWDKMLIQLGNLHQAGQQLAEARERAAKAETEAKFLRDRLTEVRAQAASSAPPVAEPAPSRKRVSIEVEDGTEESTPATPEAVEEVVVEAEPSEGVTDLSSYSIAVIKHLYGTWKNRPRR